MLAYWINERETIRRKKEWDEAPKPWSDDPIFQKTYFCNVKREDDRVTRFLRNEWYPLHTQFFPHFELAVIAARFINWPDTLREIPQIERHWSEERLDEWVGDVEFTLNARASRGEKAWGHAYVVTTSGVHMPKAQYLADRVLRPAHRALERVFGRGAGYPSGYALAQAHELFTSLRGVASFMSGQIIADLKNTPLHPLADAPDWMTWATPGPGSLRGLSWFFERKITPKMFGGAIGEAWQLVEPHVNTWGVIHMQDFQNCLCEYDKYMRVKAGTGRSKRSYPGC
jgi:hypothetical protein